MIVMIIAAASTTPPTTATTMIHHGNGAGGDTVTPPDEKVMTGSVVAPLTIVALSVLSAFGSAPPSITTLPATHDTMTISVSGTCISPERVRRNAAQSKSAKTACSRRLNGTECGRPANVPRTQHTRGPFGQADGVVVACTVVPPAGAVVTGAVVAPTVVAGMVVAGTVVAGTVVTGTVLPPAAVVVGPTGTVVVVTVVVGAAVVVGGTVVVGAGVVVGAAVVVAGTVVVGARVVAATVVTAALQTPDVTPTRFPVARLICAISAPAPPGAAAPHDQPVVYLLAHTPTVSTAKQFVN